MASIELVEGFGEQLENQNSLEFVRVTESTVPAVNLPAGPGVQRLPETFSSLLTNEHVQECWSEARRLARLDKQQGKRGITSHTIQATALQLIADKGAELEAAAAIAASKPKARTTVKRKILRKVSRPIESPVASPQVKVQAAPVTSSVVQASVADPQVTPVFTGIKEDVRARITFGDRAAVSRCTRVIDDPNYVVLIYDARSERPLMHLKTPTLFDVCRLRVRYDGQEVTRRVLSGACRFQDNGSKYVLFFVVPDSM